MARTYRRCGKSAGPRWSAGPGAAFPARSPPRRSCCDRPKTTLSRWPTSLCALFPSPRPRACRTSCKVPSTYLQVRCVFQGVSGLLETRQQPFLRVLLRLSGAGLPCSDRGYRTQGRSFVRRVLHKVCQFLGSPLVELAPGLIIFLRESFSFLDVAAPPPPRQEAEAAFKAIVVCAALPLGPQVGHRPHRVLGLRRPGLVHIHDLSQRATIIVDQ